MRVRNPDAQPQMTDLADRAADASDSHSVSRRDFLVRASQLGGALTIAGPALGRGLLAMSVHPLPLASGDDAALQEAAILAGLRWRHLGPFRGGRVAAATGVPGRPNEFYFGAVNGGVWKSIDAGRVWIPVFDSQPIASIGAIA